MSSSSIAPTPELQSLPPDASRRRGVILAVALLSTFMAAVEGTIIATVIPTIVGQLGDFHLFSWLFAIYLLTQAVTQPIYGRLSDIYGRARVYYVGAGIFLVGSLLCGFATTMLQLIVFRGLQGIGAGVLQPIAIILIGDNYEGDERARKQGWVSSMWGIAAIIGPAAGALLVGLVHWRFVFWINLPFCVLTLALVGLYVRDARPRGSTRVDYAGALLLMLGTGLILAGLSQMATAAASVTGMYLAAGVGLLVALALVERRAADPIIPLGLWTMRNLRLSYLGAILIGTVLTCVIAFLPSYVQAVLRGGPPAAAMVIATLQVGWVTAAMTISRVIGRFPYRITGAVGGSLLMLGSVILAMMTPERGIAWAVIGGTVIGLGMGSANLTYVLACQTGIDTDRRGGAIATTLFMRSVGTSLGASLGGLVLNWNVQRLAPGMGGAIQELMRGGSGGSLDPAAAARVGDAISQGLHQVYSAMAVLAFAAIIVPLLLPRDFGPWTEEQR